MSLVKNPKGPLNHASTGVITIPAKKEDYSALFVPNEGEVVARFHNLSSKPKHFKFQITECKEDGSPITDVAQEQTKDKTQTPAPAKEEHRKSDDKIS